MNCKNVSIYLSFFCADCEFDNISIAKLQPVALWIIKFILLGHTAVAQYTFFSFDILSDLFFMRFWRKIIDEEKFFDKNDLFAVNFDERSLWEHCQHLRVSTFFLFLFPRQNIEIWWLRGLYHNIAKTMIHIWGENMFEKN